MGMTEAVHFDNVQFAFDGAPVIENASFTVQEGDFMSVIGPNGAGKTTLARLLLGLLEPQAGTVRVFGRSPQSARSQLGYMPQYAQFDPAFPVTVMDVAVTDRLASVDIIPADVGEDEVDLEGSAPGEQ